MTLSVHISPKAVTAREGAKVELKSSEGASIGLDIDFTSLLQRVKSPSEMALDFLLLGTAVYAADKLVRRHEASDRWTRSFELLLPVKEPDKWESLGDVISDCVGFLTGDSWSFQFEERANSLVRRKIRKRRSRTVVARAKGSAVSLFSGGLDSLVGIIDWLEENPAESLVVVGHHDPSVSGPKSDQNRLLGHLRPAYPSRISPVLIGAGDVPSGPEITFRSRSLLFLAIGVAVADALGEGTPLLIPENGTIALNLPLTPSRRGSCSTRTAHPYYLKQLQVLLDGLGLQHSVSNPLVLKTKGEVAAECRNPALLQKTTLDAVSCAKNHHKRWWKNRDAKGCGACMPCIFRRAALHNVGLDTQTYGYDVCRGDVDVHDEGSEAADDFRACLSLLRRNPSGDEIGKQLISNGPLDISDLRTHSQTVQRAMEEIRELLKAKATQQIQKMAGIHAVRKK